MNKSCKLLYLEVRSEHASVEVRINDVVIDRSQADTTTQAFIPVPQYVLGGPNVLSLATWRPTLPQDPPRVAWARVAIFSDGDRAFEDAGETLTKLELSVTSREESRFASPVGPETWNWMGAAQLPRSVSTDPDLVAFVEGVQRAINNSDGEAVADAADMKLADAALAFGKDFIAAREAFATRFSKLPKLTNLIERSPQERNWTVCGNRRLVELKSKDGAPWLERSLTNGSLETIKLPAFAAQFSGIWKIVR